MAYPKNFSADPLYETLTLMPPVKGLISPYKGILNPFVNVGRSTTMNNWRLRANVLQLLDGYAEQGSGIAAGQVKMLTSYKSSTTNDLIYIDGVNLKRYDLNNPGNAPVTVISNIYSSNYASRAAYVRFRNRILIGTMQDGLWWYDPENKTGRKAGVTAPGSNVSAAAGAAGVLTGTYRYFVSFVNDQGHESNLATPTTSVVLTAQQGAITSIPLGGTGTVKRKLYRSVAGGSSPLLLTTIADNITTTYNDNTADTGLGAVHTGLNSVPPTSIRNMAATATRVYLADGATGITMWASVIDAQTGLPNWEGFPSSLSVNYPFLGGQDIFQAITPIGQTIFVWGGLTGFRTLGDVATQSYTEPLPWGVGWFSPFGGVMTPAGLMFIDNEKKLRLFNGSQAPQIVGTEIYSLLDSMQATAGLDGPDMVWDQPNQAVYINYGTAANSANTKTVVYYTDIKEANTSDYKFEVSYYSQTDKTLYSSINGQTKLFVRSGFQAAGSNFASQAITFLPIAPIPGEDVYLIRLQIVVKAQPIVSGVLPMLTVQYAFDDGAFFERKNVDISKDYLVYKGGEGPVKRVVDVPLYKRAESITLSISPASNTASVTNGSEIYAIILHYKASSEAKTSRRAYASIGRVRSDGGN